MDICKVYRGLDSPCKIKGVLSHYFYIVFCAYLVSFVFVLFSFSSILQKGTVLSFLVEAVIELGIPTALYVYFYRKSDKVKIRKDNRVITISNRGLYRALNQRRYRLRCIHFTRMNWQHAMLYLYRHSPICLTIVGCISRIFSEVFPSSQPVWGCRIWPNLIRSTFQEGNILSTAV